MKLIIDGQRVRLSYLFFKDGGGQIVQVRIDASTGTSYPLHSVLKEQLPRLFNGVMDKADPDSKGYTEIRILNGTFLEFIDAVRFFGIGVLEDEPKPE